MTVNDHLNQKKATDGREGSTERDIVEQNRGNHQEGTIHAEKMRYKNADEIYE
ncbi:MAG TPA: hypothetical protein VNM69_22855 [Bacillus sp. (in: firmicutes)]|uniref:hypothetical protein n=1 Tax=Bacillus litorisediminis TaxID=2922713 RepID=UPI001FAC999D|nr:hypothetical protein [Bacillus litorisediminis]HWO78708.1 hypothetical protein [Bacillus sp. (in: firmicutes)]